MSHTQKTTKEWVDFIDEALEIIDLNMAINLMADIDNTDNKNQNEFFEKCENIFLNKNPIEIKTLTELFNENSPSQLEIEKDSNILKELYESWVNPKSPVGEYLNSKIA